jgi:hypothetical protein
MCIAVIILLVKNSKLKYQLEGGEDENAGENLEADIDEEEEADDELSLEEHTEAVTEDSDAGAEAADKEATEEAPEASQEVNGIILEDAAETEDDPVVPEMEEEKVSPVEEAMKQRPYGIDSAFDVVAEEKQESAPVDAGPKIEVPTPGLEDEDEI